MPLADGRTAENLYALPVTWNDQLGGALAGLRVDGTFWPDDVSSLTRVAELVGLELAEANALWRAQRSRDEIEARVKATRDMQNAVRSERRSAVTRTDCVRASAGPAARRADRQRGPAAPVPAAPRASPKGRPTMIGMDEAPMAASPAPARSGRPTMIGLDEAPAAGTVKPKNDRPTMIGLDEAPAQPIKPKAVDRPTVTVLDEALSASPPRVAILDDEPAAEPPLLSVREAPEFGGDRPGRDADSDSRRLASL